MCWPSSVKEKHPKVARILLTGGNIDDKVKRALEDETVHVLIQKPWHMDSIRRAMEHVIKGDSRIHISKVAKPPTPAARVPSGEISTIQTAREAEAQRDWDGEAFQSSRAVGWISQSV